MRISRIALIVVATLLFGIAHGAGQTWCDPADFPFNTGHPMASNRLLPQVRNIGASATELMEQDWRAVNENLVLLFRNFVVTEALDQEDENLQKFDTALTRFLGYDEIRIQYVEPTYNEIKNSLSFEFEAEEGSGQNVSLFLECAALAGDEEGQAIAYFADTLFEYGRMGFPAAVTIGGQVVGDIYSTHRNRLLNGLPMWPQETWLNGMSIDFDSNEPEIASDRQWILLRPSISPALSFESTETSELDAALMIEAFGFIKYRPRSEYRKWQGASLVATITGDNGVGYGAIYRYGSWILGGAYHRKNDEWMLYASLDLYDLITPRDKRTGEAQDFLSNLAEHLKGKAIAELDERGGITR